jgi:multicomponent Na+:H+ antiporter subunit A
VADDRPHARGAHRSLAPASAILAALLLAATLIAWSSGGGSLDLPWAPALGLRLHFRLDGLAVLYILLATGVAVAVFAYSARYLPLHLAHGDRPAGESVRFYALLVLFMGAMIGLATAQDLILLFVFWDITAIASYYLIAYDRHEAESRWAALMALLVTGVSAVLLLIGALVLQAEYGTFSLPEILEQVRPGGAVTLAGALIALAAIAKSAQVPFHFWLPRAMTAPTPVSAYLHSAAMVAAGVLLIGRTYPVLESSRLVLDGLVVVGVASMLVGGLLALSRDEIKRLLACSTFSQYGYVVFLYGLGGPLAATAAGLYVLAHGIAKSALFLTAGAVTEATGGRNRLSDLGGLARELPVLAGARGGVAVGGGGGGGGGAGERRAAADARLLRRRAVLRRGARTRRRLRADRGRRGGADVRLPGPVLDRDLPRRPSGRRGPGPAPAGRSGPRARTRGAGRRPGPEPRR